MTDKLAALRERHMAEERELIRGELEAAEWFVRPAARRLGISEKSLLTMTGRHGRHERLGDEARAQRAAAGYQRGRPMPGG